MATPAARRRNALVGLGALGAALGFLTAWSTQSGEVSASPEVTARPVALQVPVDHADAGELVISGVTGTTASTALLRRARRGEIAGVILMGRSIQSKAQVRRLTSSLQAAAESGGQPPLLIMADQEGGTVRRFDSARPIRSARSLAGLGTAGVRRQGRGSAKDLLALGVNVNLAPVADVPTSPSNFLGSRTFGTTASAVARNACAFAGGLRSGGVVPTLKHFPGLGATGGTNTDDGKVTIRASRTALERSWAAYRQCGGAALEARVGADALADGTEAESGAAAQRSGGADSGTLTMLSSAAYSALTGATPAVLSTSTYDAARGAGASGPFITDALEARALAGRRRVAPRAVDAGANLVLYTGESASELGRRQLRAHVRQTVLDARAEPVRALRASLTGG